MDERVTDAEAAAWAALVDNAVLGNWYVLEFAPHGVSKHWDVYEGDSPTDVDANSMAECYEERVANFIAAAPEIVRRLLAERTATVSGEGLDFERQRWLNTRREIREWGHMMGNEGVADFIVGRVDEYAAALEAELAAAQAQLRKYEEPM